MRKAIWNRAGFMGALAGVALLTACVTLRVDVPQPDHCDPDRVDAPLERLTLEISAPDAARASELVERLRDSDGPLLFVDDLSASDLSLDLRSEIPECVRLADQGRRGEILDALRTHAEADGLGKLCSVPVPGCKQPTPLAALSAQGSYRPAAFAGEPGHRFVLLQYACTDAGALRTWLRSRPTPRGVAWGTSRLPGTEPPRTYFSCPQDSGLVTRLGTEPTAQHATAVDHPVPPASCWVRLEGTTRLSQAELFVSALEDLGARPSGACVSQQGALLCPLTCSDDPRRDLETLSNGIEGAQQPLGGVEILGLDPLGHVLSLRLSHP